MCLLEVFSHLFSKYLWRICYFPGTVLSISDSLLTDKNSYFLGNDIQLDAFNQVKTF